MSGLGDITGKAKDFLQNEKVKDALKSEQAEDVSDKLLDGVAGAANRLTGGKFAGQIDGARDAADGAVGTPKGGTPKGATPKKIPRKTGTQKPGAAKR